MARTTRIRDEDAHIVQLALEHKRCDIHIVRGEAKWRRCVKCSALIYRKDDDGSAQDSHHSRSR